MSQELVLEFDIYGDSQLFSAVDEEGRSYRFCVRRLPRRTFFSNAPKHESTETVPYTYFLVCENGRNITGGMTFAGIVAAVSVRLLPQAERVQSNAIDPSGWTEEERNQHTNYGAF